MSTLKISIITVCLNAETLIEPTIQSVIAQDYENIEYIIIDGASTDKTIEIIKRYSTHLSSFISEKDSGIYNAMNKGIHIATGDYLLFLNAGDKLHSNDVISKFVESSPSSEIVSCIEQTSGIIVPPEPEELNYLFFYDDTLMHQSTFISKHSFEKYGEYDEKFSIVSDWKWFFNALIRFDASYEKREIIMSDFDENGISNNSNYKSIQEKERKMVHSEILPRCQQMYAEIIKLRSSKKEFDSLKNGKFGFLIRAIIQLKNFIATYK